MKVGRPFMTLKKIERSQRFLKKHLTLFRCPICHLPYQAVQEDSLVCPQDHRLDLNRQGTLYFLRHQVHSEYNRTMLLSRRRILQSGLFNGFLQVIAQKMITGGTTLDVGCGEGTPLHFLEKQAGTAVGFDLSKAGIKLATQQPTTAFFCVADLAQLPFNAQTFQSVLNIFSPSNYQEFSRILAPEGQVIKVIPNSDYLVELRRALFADDARRHYSNQKVQSRFKEKYGQVTTQRVRYQFTVPEAQFTDLVVMTPLHWQASTEQIHQLVAHPFSQITVDVTVLVGQYPRTF